MIGDYIRSQVERGFMAGPFPPQACTGIVCSRMAVIPEKTPEKWQVIVDLSHPGDRSVNHLIRREATHVAYLSTGDAAHLMHFLRRNALMAKLDIKEAYRIIPIHPDDHRFFGVCWQGQVYVDCQLPFGLASAPVIFSALGEALEWILRQRGVKAVIHYIDDFLLLGPPSSPECKEALAVTHQTCQELGVPIAPEKTEGPITSITFLGIQLDSTSMTVSIPQDKLTKLQSMVRAACKLESVNDVHFLESLVGHLVHATTVCPLAKAFLHHLFTLKAALKPGQTRRLNLSTRTNLAWWDALLESSLTPDSGPWDPQVHLALADIALTNIQSQRAIILRIKASKTNQLRVGTTIVLGATKAEICPVAALLDYLNRRGCTPGPWPLFITEGGTPLRRQAFVDNIQRALTAAGLEGSKFKGHSFRISAATTASEVGVPETTIKILGRWRSMAYQRYIRPPPDKLAQVATMLVSPVSSGSELS